MSEATAGILARGPILNDDFVKLVGNTPQRPPRTFQFIER